MADLKTTITAGNSKIWTDDTLQFYPSGDELFFGPNGGEVYNDYTYPLVTSLTTNAISNGTHKMAAASAAHQAWKYAETVETALTASDLNINNNFVKRTFKVNNKDWVGGDEITLAKSDIGLTLVSDYGFMGIGDQLNSDIRYSSTAYTYSKAKWVSSLNARPDGDVVGWAVALDTPISMTVNGAMTGAITKANGAATDIWNRGNIEITVKPNISPTITINGAGHDAASGTMTELGDVSFNLDVHKGSSTVSGTLKLKAAIDSNDGTDAGFAATPSAVKTAYDLAAAALPKSGGTMAGAITLGTNNITGSTTTVKLNLSASPKLESDKNVIIQADSTFNSITESAMLAGGKNQLKVISHAAETSTTNLKYNTKTVWTAGNHGTGSTLDADMVDGAHRADLGELARTTTQSWTGNQVFKKGIAVGGTINTDKDFYNNSSIAIGDDDSGIKAPSAGTIELWANNVKVLSYNSTSITAHKDLTAENKGNAATASKWKDERTITFHSTNSDLSGAVTFDGSANVSWENVSVKDNSHEHSVLSVLAVTNNLTVGNDLLVTGTITESGSDSRLKDIQEHIDPKEALENVCKWNKVKYKWNDTAKELMNYESTKIEIGLLADEIHEDYPELTPLAPFDNDIGVSKSGEDYKTLQYNRIVAIQAAAITELNRKVEELSKPWYVKLFNFMNKQ